MEANAAQPRSRSLGKAVSKPVWLAFVVLLLGVALGFWIWRTNPRLRAARQIEGLGGQLLEEPGESGETVVSVILIARNVSDTDLGPICAWTGFQRLFVDATKITDAGLSQLASLRQLEFLSLGSCRITDQGLAHLQGLPRLRTLNLAGCSITDKGLEQLRKMSSLRDVSLKYTRVTKQGLDNLAKVRPTLRTRTEHEADPDD